MRQGTQGGGRGASCSVADRAVDSYPGFQKMENACALSSSRPALIVAGIAPSAAQPAKPGIHLVPHRAVYDLSLLRSQGSRGLDSARGRIAMDFGGDACDGYTLNYRQVTVLNSNESGARTVDTQTATFEAGDGLSMRFKTTSTSGSAGASGVDGDARLKPGRDPRCPFQAATKRRLLGGRAAGLSDRASQAGHRGRPAGPDHRRGEGL